MKKKLKSELISLAHRILKLDSDSNYSELQEEAKRLYETLTILAFTEKHFDGVKPTIGKTAIIEALQDKKTEEVVEIFNELDEPTLRVEDNIRRVSEIAKANERLFEKARKRKEQLSEKDDYRPDGTELNQNEEALHEPVIEKIKDMVAQMPPEADDIDEMFQQITGEPKYQKNDMKDIGEYGRLAEFEDKKETPSETKQRSLNDRLTKGLSFGLNDRIAFIKHLFNGSATDYNRVLSQLNTVGSKSEAINFINQMVKPDYNNWSGKEVYESRFIDLVEKKFEK